MDRCRIACAALALLVAATGAEAAEPAPGAPAAPAGSGAERLLPLARKPGATAKTDLTASGTFVRIGEKSAYFAGSFEGILDVQDPPGDAAVLDGAKLLCAGVFLVDLSNRFQESEGRCALTAANGDQAFADYECGGDAQKGCKGSLEISGASGGWKGLAGGGDLLLEGGVADAAESSLGKRVEDIPGGPATWSKIVLTLP
jgi:hypothetical protein